MKLITLSVALSVIALSLGACKHRKQQAAYPSQPAPVQYAK